VHREVQAWMLPERLPLKLRVQRTLGADQAGPAVGLEYALAGKLDSGSANVLTYGNSLVNIVSGS
jgi:hypothetical protein